MLEIDSAARTTCTYNAANEVVTAMDASGTTTYSFDANGNQEITLAPGGNRTTNAWDYENRLTQVVQPGAGNVSTFSYDPDGEQVKKQDTSGTTKFIWDGENYLAETDGSDVTQEVYTNEPNVYGNLVSRRRGGSTFWYHFDGLGSTDRLTDISQNVTDSYVYKAYGELAASSGSTTNPFQFVGRMGYYFDNLMDEHYLRTRYYDSRLARFLTKDQLGHIKDNDNPYQYAAGRPTLKVDPNGERPWQLGCFCTYTPLEPGHWGPVKVRACQFLEEIFEVWHMWICNLSMDDDRIEAGLPCKCVWAPIQRCKKVCDTKRGIITKKVTKIGRPGVTTKGYVVASGLGLGCNCPKPTQPLPELLCPSGLELEYWQ